MLVYLTCSLPLMPDGETIDMRYMPTLCNGHIGTQPFGNAVYMNPLFTGDDGESAVINVRICQKSSISRKESQKWINKPYHASCMYGIDILLGDKCSSPLEQ